ncbi:MAG: CHAT domain-containing tetratricopeptide repeat protein [Lyngbya sp.]|nr:CHAT domain-containing tetratricopeptide repeat protein [Lyngbya sp.]
MYSRAFTKLFKTCLIILSTTFFVLEFTQKPVQGNPLFFDTLELNPLELDTRELDTREFKNRLGEADRLTQEVLELYGKGLYVEAIPLAERALSIYQELFGEQDLQVAMSLNNLAALYEEIGRWNQAEPLLKKALEIRENLLENYHPDLAQSLNNLAKIYGRQEKYSEAESLYKQALSIYRKIYQNNHVNSIFLASTLSNLATLYYNQGKVEEAIPLYEEALKIYQKISKENSLAENSNMRSAEISILNNLASIYYEQKKYAKASELFEKVMENYEQRQESEHPLDTRELDTREFKNRLGEADRLTQEVLELYDKGLYVQAIPLAERALSIYQELFGEQDLKVATSLNNLAALYEEIDRWNQAEPLFKKVLEIRENLLENYHPDLAQSLNNLAKVYRIQGKYSEAESLYERALSIYRKISPNNRAYSMLLASTLSNLATLYYNQGKDEEAIPLYEEALKIYNQINKKDDLTHQLNMRSAENSILNNLASVYYKQKKYAKASVLFEKVIENYEQRQESDHPKLALALNNLAALQLAQGDITSAIKSLARGTDIEEKNLNLRLTMGSEGEKQAYMNTLVDTTYRAISLHIQDAPNNQDAVNLALTTILRRKGRVLDVMADSIGLLRQNLTSDEQYLFDQLEKVRQELAMLKFTEAQTLSWRRYRLRLEELEQQEEQLEAELLQRSAEFRAETQKVTIQDIQKLIPVDAALVELVRYKPFDAQLTSDEQRGRDFHYAAYILKSTGKPIWVDLGKTERINPLRFMLNLKNKVSAHKGNPEQLKVEARNLDKVLMQPIRQQLDDNIRHILLSPDGELNLIPFGALVDENGQYLIENYTFTYLTSGRDLLRFQSDTPSQQPPLIIANPNFQDKANPTTINSWADQSKSNLVSRGILSTTYDSLPGTEAEAEAIKALLPNAIVLTESDATENAIKASKSPQILHIATHGFFLYAHPKYGQENPLLRSGLALAGYNLRSSGSEDGVLTALEVTNLRLRGTQLVVLSACETGLGEVERGEGVYGFGEGVYGLRRAFVIAGVRSQLSSLWKVNDFATKELMEKYYQRLIAGEGVSEALRQTQLEMLQSPEYQHPFFWAAFIPSGHWIGITESQFEIPQVESKPTT